MKAGYVEFYHRDRRTAIFRDGDDPQRFEFSNATQRAVRREKKAKRKAVRRTGAEVIREQLSAIVEDPCAEAPQVVSAIVPLKHARWTGKTLILEVAP